jgi:predicted nucleic acid-binding protein|tara:strand:- start:68000 stop:68149 length:150 start_codon:yes stop_codon:yes gene_type:complete
MVRKYEKYRDEEDVYFYELTLESGAKCVVPKELGDHVHKLEQYKRGITL